MDNVSPSPRHLVGSSLAVSGYFSPLSSLSRGGKLGILLTFLVVENNYYQPPIKECAGGWSGEEPATKEKQTRCRHPPSRREFFFCKLQGVNRGLVCSSEEKNENAGNREAFQTVSTDRQTHRVAFPASFLLLPSRYKRHPDSRTHLSIFLIVLFFLWLKLKWLDKGMLASVG